MTFRQQTQSEAGNKGSHPKITWVELGIYEAAGPVMSWILDGDQIVTLVINALQKNHGKHEPTPQQNGALNHTNPPDLSLRFRQPIHIRANRRLRHLTHPSKLLLRLPHVPQMHIRHHASPRRRQHHSELDTRHSAPLPTTCHQMGGFPSHNTLRSAERRR